MNYSPTDIDQAMHTLSLSSPDEQFYMDTGATSHMTRSQGTLMHYSPLTHHLIHAIIVGNGHMFQFMLTYISLYPRLLNLLPLTMFYMPFALLKISSPFTNLHMTIWFPLNLIILAFL